MTQEHQFKKYGCACRCLIKLREIHQKPISTTDFIAQFYKCYEKTWKEKCGGTMTSIVIDLARELRLCTDADTRTDQNHIKNKLNETYGVLVFTDQEKQKDGTFLPNYHCRLIRGRQANDVWELWEPYADGTCRDFVPRSFEELKQEGAHFLLLYWVDEDSK